VTTVLVCVLVFPLHFLAGELLEPEQYGIDDTQDGEYTSNDRTQPGEQVGKGHALVLHLDHEGREFVHEKYSW
jgi:hypothetical protein